MLGASYVQISREGLGYQKSQTGGPNIPKAGQVSTGYHRFASTVVAPGKEPDQEKDFFEGIDTSLMGLATLAKGRDSAFLTASLRKINAAVKVPENAAFTRPYFTRPDIEQSYYDLRNEDYLSQPLAPYPLAAWADFSYDGAPVRVGQFVQTVKRVTGQGTVLEPLAAGPAIGIAIAPRFGVVSLSAKSFAVSTVIHSNVKGPANGTVRLDLPSGWKAEPASAPFAAGQDGEDRTVAFTVIPANLVEKSYAITAVAEYGGRQYREGYDLAGYSGLRPYFLYAPATYTPEFDHAFGPYPYTMSSNPEEVTDEGSKVRILAPANPLCNWPNRITEKDFEGWVGGARLEVDEVLGCAL